MQQSILHIRDKSRSDTSNEVIWLVKFSYRPSDCFSRVINWVFPRGVADKSCFALWIFFLTCFTSVHPNVYTHILVSLVWLVNKRPCDVALDFKIGAKSLPVLTWAWEEERITSYKFSREGVNGLVEPFGIVSSAYCCKIFFQQVFCVLCYLLCA